MCTSKKTIILIVTVIGFIGILGCILFSKNEITNNEQLLNEITNNEQLLNEINNDAQLLVVKSYTNYAWGFQSTGSAIFDDGSILTWNNNSVVSKNNLMTNEGVKQFILNNGKLKSAKVADKDLEKIKENISKLEDKIEIEMPGADQGTTNIYIVNDNNDKIDLKYTGDWIGENQTEESKEILKIVKKYF